MSSLQRGPRAGFTRNGVCLNVGLGNVEENIQFYSLKYRISP